MEVPYPAVGVLPGLGHEPAYQSQSDGDLTLAGDGLLVGLGLQPLARWENSWALESSRTASAASWAASGRSQSTAEKLLPGHLDQMGGVLGVLVLAEVGDEDVGALAGVGDRHRPSDATVAAGDDGGLVDEATSPR